MKMRFGMLTITGKGLENAISFFALKHLAVLCRGFYFFSHGLSKLSFRKPVFISGQDINNRHNKPDRAFSIITTAGP